MQIRRLLIAIVTVGTVIVAGTSAIRTVQTFYRLDFGVTWVMNGVQVDEVHVGSTADLAGLVQGDLITSIDGTPITSFKDPLFSSLRVPSTIWAFAARTPVIRRLSSGHPRHH